MTDQEFKEKVEFLKVKFRAWSTPQSGTRFHNAVEVLIENTIQFHEELADLIVQKATDDPGSLQKHPETPDTDAPERP